MKAIIKTGLLVLLGVFYIGAGINHFVHAPFYLKMMPPYIPAHAMMVALSGIAEIVLGIMALIPRTRKLAGWGLIALLIAVFPANLYMYQHPQLFTNLSPTALLIRLPFQGLLMLWAWWVTET